MLNLRGAKNAFINNRRCCMEEVDVQEYYKRPSGALSERWGNKEERKLEEID